MFRPVFTGLSLFLTASLLSGCAQQHVCSNGGIGANPVATPAPAEFRTERGNISPNLSALSNYEAVDRALNPMPAPVQYRVLRAEEVQCLAAANAPLAKLYEAESQAVLAGADCRGKSAASTMSELMAFRAVDERNKAAGAALELFYSITEAEANRVILDRSIEEVDRALANLGQIKQSGLKMPPDRTALERQKLDWLDRRIQLTAAARQMQGQLQQLCGFEADPTAAIWPQADLAVTIAPIDVQAAVAEGLSNRADIAALRRLDGSLSADTLPAARSGVQALSPGLGASIASRRLLGGSANSGEELQTRQSQLAQARSDAERNAGREIGESAQNIETRLREIAVSKQRAEMWGQRLSDMQKRRETDGVTAFELSAAQLEALRAEGESLHRVIAWKIAQAKLKQSQGLLAAECGYRLPRCCP